MRLFVVPIVMRRVEAPLPSLGSDVVLMPWSITALLSNHAKKDDSRGGDSKCIALRALVAYSRSSSMKEVPVC